LETWHDGSLPLGQAEALAWQVHDAVVDRIPEARLVVVTPRAVGLD
jgi:hypothetical protein